MYGFWGKSRIRLEKQPWTAPLPVAMRLRRPAEAPGGNLGGATKSELEGSQMSENAYIDRDILASPEESVKEKLSGSCETVWLAWKRGSIMQSFIISRLSGFQHLCNAMNTSDADPSKIHKRWTLRREIHCVAVLMLLGSRASAAT